MSADQKVRELGLVLPPPLQLPPGVAVPLVMVKVIDKRVIVSGHGPQNDDGSIAEPLGQVGGDVTLEEGVEAAKRVALTMMGTLQRELGSLDEIKSWVKVFGMVNSAPGFTGQTPVINGFSQTIVEVFGEEVGLAARSAVGMAGLPFNIPVEVEAELELK
ncbi:MAG: RidA family protein [Gammaproteobacteria bacterium]|jgi:enamine deaminase RidA (YjgF/YER057c/UK114 family)|nr:RidA family protein [Gammaproteobacteria bacterium]MBT5725681.1 RidA family protein [Gammaproteobacteria bacterium]MBT6586426.1 RidA family protein [Gammaproteobacteria bacterium]MBT6890584.1 RidA family protein [Gammaproteobacteria bacterium]MBT7880251.1 RidA family protein [Gammaproteobacteria bacterium]